jgi:hypothetical protein
MTDSSVDIQQLNELLKADWLDEESKEIIQDCIKRLIKLMPDMVSNLEEAFKND